MHTTKTAAVEISYFRLSLKSFLRDAHPDLADDASFIAARGDMAAEVYSEAIKSGLDHIQATEISNETLYEGLRFSPFGTILEILRNEFSDKVSPEKLRPKARKLLPLLQPVFARYELNDDFAESSLYQSLYTELIGAILMLPGYELQ